MTVMHAYDAAEMCINSVYKNAKNFRHNRKLYGYSRGQMKQRIAEDLKTFYRVGIKYPNSVEKYRQYAIIDNTTRDANDIIGYDKNDRAIWGVNLRHKITNCIQNAIMFLRLRSIKNSDSELKQLSKEYKSLTDKLPEQRWVVTEH